MNEALWISNLLLWLVVVGLAATVFALLRQVGVLHERIAPAGALMPANGPQVGEPAPASRSPIGTAAACGSAVTKNTG